MTLFHAVVWMDHDKAQVLHFDAEHVEVDDVHAEHHVTRQHHSGVRTEHEFFGHVCDALEGVTEVLVTGSKTALADFRHYVHAHRPKLQASLVGEKPVDHLSAGQLLKLARGFFDKHDRMSGVASKMV